MPFELKPHQEKAVAKMHNGCILCGGVGVGKSHTAVGYYLQNEAPRDVVVITTAKKRDKFDWQNIFVQVGMTRHPDTTMGAIVEVDSWNNIDKYKERKDAFFIFDEQRLVGSGAWVKAFYEIAKNNHWIMLSATPGDTWLDYVPVFRANGFIKNLTAFKDAHVVQRWTGRYYQIHGYRQVGKLVQWRNQLLVDMPYERHTTRHNHDILVDFDKDLVKELVTKRWHVLENRPLTDAGELFRVMRRIVYSDASRVQAVRNLLQKHSRLIVFYNFDYELELLRSLGQPDPQLEILRTLSQTTSCSELSTQNPTNSPKSLSTKKRFTTTGTSNCETNSEMPSHTREDSATDPWEYLLSLEGLRENSQLVSSNSSKTQEDGQWLRQNQEQKTNGSTFTPSENTQIPSYFLLDNDASAENQNRQAGQTNENTQPKTPNGSGVEATSSDSSGWSSRSLESSQDLMDSRAETQETSGEIWRSHPDAMTLSSTPSIPQSISNGSMDSRSEIGSTPLKTSQSSSSCGPTTQLTLSNPTSSCETIRTDSNEQEQRPISSDTSITAISSATVKETAECQEPKNHYPPVRTKTSEGLRLATGTSKTGIDTDSTTGRLSKTSTEASLSPLKPLSDPCSTGNASGSTPQFQVAEWNGHKHEDVPTTTSWVYLVQYVAGAEAWECTETDAIVFYSMPYSYKNWHQAHGRIDRMTTSFSDLHYYRLISKAVIDLAVAKSLGLKKSFNEAAFGVKLGIGQN